MGAALSSHDLDDPQHRQVLAEYIRHSTKELDECAQIFRGSVGRYDDVDDQEWQEPRGIASTIRKSLTQQKAVASYSRHLSFEHFEEVFGMLVADAEPHFEFFQEANTSDTETACAHQVFCAIALVMRADLHAKVTFLLRLYADQVGQLSNERKRLAVKDFLLALQLILNLADEVSSDVMSALEKELWAEDESKFMSVHEVYDVCFTSSHISGFLHDIQVLVEEFTADFERELQRTHSTHLLPLPTSSLDSGLVVDKAKMLTRTASALLIPQDSLLWNQKASLSLPARDYTLFWQQAHVELRSNATCVHALREMASAGTEIHSTMVFETSGPTSEVRSYSGILSTGNFLRFFLSFLPPEPTSFHVERAIRKLGAATLRDALLFSGKVTHRFQCIDEDEAFFNVLLRFARGAAESVAVVVADAMDHPNSLLLGTFTVMNLLEWVEEDLTLFNGKESHALRAFPSFFYSPTSVNATLTSVCEGFVAMSERRLGGILVTFKDNSASRVLRWDCGDRSCETFRDFFAQSYDVWADLAGENASVSPLLCSLGEIAQQQLPKSVFVSSESSIASVIRVMVDARSTRVFIRKEASEDGIDTGPIVGVVRATDIFLLLLKEQHAATTDSSTSKRMDNWRL